MCVYQKERGREKERERERQRDRETEKRQKKKKLQQYKGYDPFRILTIYPPIIQLCTGHHPHSLHCHVLSEAVSTLPYQAKQVPSSGL